MNKCFLRISHKIIYYLFQKSRLISPVKVSLYSPFGFYTDCLNLANICNEYYCTFPCTYLTYIAEIQDESLSVPWLGIPAGSRGHLNIFIIYFNKLHHQKMQTSADKKHKNILVLAILVPKEFVLQLGKVLYQQLSTLQ